MWVGGGSGVGWGRDGVVAGCVGECRGIERVCVEVVGVNVAQL